MSLVRVDTHNPYCGYAHAQVYRQHMCNWSLQICEQQGLHNTLHHQVVKCSRILLEHDKDIKCTLKVDAVGYIPIK